MNPMMQKILQQAIQSNPRMAQSQQIQEYIQVLQTGDAERGRKLAENICKTYGVTPEQAYAQSKQFFHFQ